MPAQAVSKRSTTRGRKRCRAEGCRRLAPLGEAWCGDEHNPLRNPAEHVRSSPILGKVEPRLWTPPLRPLTRETTRGYEVNEFAQIIGEPNMAWQEWLNIHALELLDDGTYRFRIVLVLVARQNGKSNGKRKLSLWRLYMDGARCILGTAQDVALAREQMDLAKGTIITSPDLMAGVNGRGWGDDRSVNGDEQFWLSDDSLPSGAPRELYPRYVIRATNRKAGRGLSIDELNIDELREQRDWDAWSAVSKTVMARPYAQTWVLSNAGDDQSVVLNQLRSAAGVYIDTETGISQLAEARDESIGIFEWSAPEGCELDDWDAIAQANPGLNRGGPNTAAIRSSLTTDPPEVYRTEVLCQKVDALDAAIDQAAWRACRDKTGTLNFLRDRVAACIDVSPDGAHATLAAAAMTDSGRIRVEVVEAWSGTDDVLAVLDSELARVRPVVVGWYPSGPGGALSTVLRPRDLKTDSRKRNVPDGWKYSRKKRRYYIELTGLRVTELCQGFKNLVGHRRILQPDDPLINNHVAGAVPIDSGDGWRFARRGVGHVDATYAVAGAAQLAQIMPAETRPRIRSVAA